MGYYFVKVAISAVMIVAISEVAKRSSLFGAILASIPLISVLAIIWLYIETNDTGKVIALTTSVFWLVLPSLVFFLLLPPLLRHGANFMLGLGISVGATVGCYFFMIFILNRFGIRL